MVNGFHERSRPKWNRSELAKHFEFNDKASTLRVGESVVLTFRDKTTFDDQPVGRISHIEAIGDQLHAEVVYRSTPPVPMPVPIYILRAA